LAVADEDARFGRLVGIERRLAGEILPAERWHCARSHEDDQAKPVPYDSIHESLLLVKDVALIPQCELVVDVKI